MNEWHEWMHDEYYSSHTYNMTRVHDGMGRNHTHKGEESLNEVIWLKHMNNDEWDECRWMRRMSETEWGGD